MAHTTKRLFSMWIPFAAALVMIFLVVGNFVTGNVNSVWSWIEVSFLTILALYFLYYGNKARRSFRP